ncbi:DNA oxidative demethylase AlkB [Aquabacterium soli]|uniref:DNA oxidative demethylase AlkB n=1 Tax=Aquabacterium soli TaxID=2493092 RepID=A0A3R8YQF7_9BURK|nr:DNA oxidative demethylase AlkB [Aquabacterium soli]RRS05644.1 DNA oxidative demethylase AlkB [Aquabacterium soli]
MTLPLFDDAPGAQPGHIEWLGEQACVLHGQALPHAAALIDAFDAVAAQAPFRHLVTPGGATMSVAMTNCGPLGWVSDRRGYRYSPEDPASGLPWPPMPAVFRRLAQQAAKEAGFGIFEPDACLVNRYTPGTRLSLHQDRDEQDYKHPIVSVSLGMPATFLFGGLTRAERPRRILLEHGDVVVWGGVDRLRFHGIAPLKDHPHPRLGSVRLNLTFRRAGA